ncbi:hypothetical protein CPLU01_05838 [Colletotrichum plurivorum]|uniref:Beta/gamma crystallin 'Greek key' domain-containing protein n=1 Tax=Colletotrichum plurivorum TaxID=2175906 RepID=A0A8H6NGT1_9PEZI|nr:hypothetical protein CPLU01_05838 [Colletotrichum plurivorum]
MVSAKFAIASIAAVYAVAVAAAPVEDATGSVLVARAEVSVFMCEDKDFRGRCQSEIAETGRCYDVRGEFIDRISSIRNNDRNDNTCTWYRERACRGESYRNQDDKNLGDGNGRFNDAIRSYECRRK